jgi:hypothetical protein
VTKKVNKLSDLSIDEVSLVDRGANQHAEIVLSKRFEVEELEDENVEKANPDQASVYVEGDDEDDDEELDEEPSVEKGYFSRLVDKMFTNNESATANNDTGRLPPMSDVEKFGQDPRLQQQAQFGAQQPPPQPPPPGPPGPVGPVGPAPGPQGAMPPPEQPQAFPAQDPNAPQPGQMQAGPPLPDEVVQYIQQLEQALADAQGTDQPSDDQENEDMSNNPFGKSLDDLDQDEVSFLAELSKNLEDEDTREAVTKAMEAVSKANERAEAAESIAKAERDHRLNAEYVAKARSYVNLPVKAEEFGPVLKALHEALDEDQLGVITKALSAANESVANLGAFTEIGKRGGGSYETISKADVAANELVKNSGGEVSKEQALERVFDADPSLYDEYLQESGN